MIKKILLTIVLLFFINNCGFSPIYNNAEKYDFKIKVINFEGDKTINNYLKFYFKKYEKKENDKLFKINVVTNYNKETLSKDKTGGANDFEISITSKFSITLNDKFIKDITIGDKRIIKNEGDEFSKIKYENSIKKNSANTIYEKLIIQLSSLR